MRRLAAILLVLVAASSAAAQSPVVRHRCWDIVVEREADDRPNVLVPMMEAVDSGALLVTMAMDYLGTPYRYAGRTPKAFDCAGFALYLYKHFDLRPGDLVFFGGRGNKKVVGHTGIVVDTDVSTGVFRFIHASTGAGVIVSRSTEEYYSKRYLTARRIFR